VSKSILGHIRNDEIRTRLGVKRAIIDVIQRKRLKWYGHVVRRHQTGYVNAKKRLLGRPKKKWREADT